jgi:hypothetical protein
VQHNTAQHNLCYNTRVQNPYLDAELAVVWEHERPEAEAVRADGREQDAGHLRVHHAAASSQRVGGGASGGANDQAVTLQQQSRWQGCNNNYAASNTDIT